MGDVDEAAGSRIENAKAADIDVAGRVILRKSKRREGAIAAVDEIELREAVEQRFRESVLAENCQLLMTRPPNGPCSVVNA